ncbi:MAG: sigma 54-interacting transcriptional regulator [Pseudomonadota bacterium]
MAESIQQDVRVLVVDGNAKLSSCARKLIDTYGATAEVAGDQAEARARLDARDYDLVFVDPDDHCAVELIRDYEARRNARFVFMRPRSGANGATTNGAAANGVSANGTHVTDAEPEAFADWIGSSPALRHTKKQISMVAPLNTTVFLLGESGTGKELAADAIHRLSGRQGEFMTINCGAIPESLIANELFGHEKGSYTGASRAQPGLFERANGGTVFLDEVTELPLEHQPALLRVLETRSVTRIGGGKSIPLDVRVVAATNRVDEQLVEKKILREDLFYRLMAFPIVMPPLRERAGDIPQFVDAMLRAWNDENGTRVTCAHHVLEQLEQHHWPGNIRELKHTLQRLAILSDGEIVDPPNFFNDFACGDAQPGLPVGTTIKELEKRLILATLEHYHGDRARTASTLGISQKTLYNRLKTYEKQGCRLEEQKKAS